MTTRDAKTGRFVKVTHALTAAAAVLPEKAIDQMPMTAKDWQARAWRLRRILGVLYFPTLFKAKQVGRLKWDVEVDGKMLEPEQAVEAMKAITSPLGVREASVRMALNFEVAGEVFYARINDEWNVFASTTPKRRELLKSADVVVRGWQADPEQPNEPTSAIQASLGTAEAIRLMSAMSRSQDRNRLAQRGILLVPSEITFPDGDDFDAMLEQSMMASIADEYAGSAVVPLKVRSPAEFIDKWKHLVLESPYDDKLMERIEATVKQLALELDMPPEMLLGNMDSNHWNAWLSDESNYAAHVEPLGTLVAGVYAQAMMQATGDTREIVVTPDPSELLARRSSVTDAFEALRNLVVGFEYVRKAIGADDDDAPSDDEIALILAAQGQVPPGTPAIGTGQTNPVAPALPEAAPVPSSNGNGQVTAAVDAETESELDALGRALSDIDMHLRSKLVGAVRMAVENAREKIEGEAVGAQERVAGHMQRLGKVWGRELKEARQSLQELGIDAEGPEWEQAAEQSVAILVDGVTDYAVKVLDVPDSEMPALPGDVLRRVVAVAGGSETVTVAAAGLPPPTTQDALGFGVGTLTTKALKADGIVFKQWRFRYGPLARTHPFHEHREQDGRFATPEGEVNGYHPGDHLGCLCGLTPVFTKVASPKVV